MEPREEQAWGRGRDGRGTESQGRDYSGSRALCLRCLPYTLKAVMSYRTGPWGQIIDHGKTRRRISEKESSHS